MYIYYFITMFASGIVLAEQAAQPNASTHSSVDIEIKTEASMSGRTGDHSLLKFPLYGIYDLPNIPIARQKRYAVHHQHEIHQQYQPHLEKRRDIYNYAIHLGSRCLSCHETITCLPGHRVFIRRCNHIFRYCNNGHCSMIPGALCLRPSMRITSTTTTTPSSINTTITITDGTTTAAALTPSATTTSSTGFTTTTPITTTTSTIATPTSTTPPSSTASTTSTIGVTTSPTVASSTSTTGSTLSTIDSTTTASTTKSNTTSTTTSSG